MSLEVVVIDDMEIVQLAVSQKIKSADLIPLKFSTAKECIDNLNRIPKENYPIGWFVDMKLINDLGGPERLYNYLKEKSMLRNFYFITGNESVHDKEVKQKTGAKILIKGQIEYPKILEKMKENLS